MTWCDMAKRCKSECEYGMCFWPLTLWTLWRITRRDRREVFLGAIHFASFCHILPFCWADSPAFDSCNGSMCHHRVLDLATATLRALHRARLFFHCFTLVVKTVMSLRSYYQYMSSCTVLCRHLPSGFWLCMSGDVSTGSRSTLAQSHPQSAVG